MYLRQHGAVKGADAYFFTRQSGKHPERGPAPGWSSVVLFTRVQWGSWSCFYADCTAVMGPVSPLMWLQLFVGCLPVIFFVFRFLFSRRSSQESKSHYCGLVVACGQVSNSSPGPIWAWDRHVLEVVWSLPGYGYWSGSWNKQSWKWGLEPVWPGAYMQLPGVRHPWSLELWYRCYYQEFSKKRIIPEYFYINIAAMGMPILGASSFGNIQH